MPNQKEIAGVITYIMVSMRVNSRTAKTVVVLSLMIIERLLENSQKYTIESFKIENLDQSGPIFGKDFLTELRQEGINIYDDEQMSYICKEL